MEKRMKYALFGVGGLFALALMSTHWGSPDEENTPAFDQALTKSGLTDFYYVDRLKLLAVWLSAEMNRLSSLAENKESADMSVRLSNLLADEIKRQDIALTLQAVDAVKKHQQEIAFLLPGKDNYEERLKEQFKAAHEYYRRVYAKLKELGEGATKEFLELGNPRLFAFAAEQD